MPGEPAADKGEGPTLASSRARRTDILRMATAHGASNVRLFGSIARETSHRGSDVDLLVDPEPGRTMTDYVRLWKDLEELLGTSVDVVSAAALTDRDDAIRGDAVPL